MNVRLRLWALGVILGALPLVFGCFGVLIPEGNGGGGNGGPGPGTAGVSFEQIQTIFDGKCENAGCHRGANAPNGLDLAANVSYGNLVGVPAQENPSQMRISAGHPETSYLFCKVDPSCNAIQGGHMPLGGSALSAGELGQIKEWIVRGAPSSGGGTGGGNGPTYEQVQKVFNVSCAGGSCHLGSTAPPYGLDLSDGVSYDNLVGVASAENPSEMRIQPGQPERSYLLCKVDASCISLVGAHMPLGLSGLPAAEVKLIRDWILAGAPPPAGGGGAGGAGGSGGAGGTGGTGGGGVDAGVDAGGGGGIDAGVDAGGGGGGTPPVSFSATVAPILRSNCGGCHGNAGGLDMSSAARAYSNLVNVFSRECTSTLRVQPGAPDQSYLIIKLRGDRNVCFAGGVMPLGGRLSTTTINTIITWISQGAPNN